MNLPRLNFTVSGLMLIASSTTMAHSGAHSEIGLGHFMTSSGHILVLGVLSLAFVGAWLIARGDSRASVKISKDD